MCSGRANDVVGVGEDRRPAARVVLFGGGVRGSPLRECEMERPCEMERLLTGSVAIVTGASRGLGLAFALELAECGATLT